MVNQNIHHLLSANFLDESKKKKKKMKKLFFLRLKGKTTNRGHYFPADVKLYQTEIMQRYEAFVDVNEIAIIT